VFGLNNHLLRWSEASVACTTQFWEDEQFMLQHAVQKNLAVGQYFPPTSGRFFSVETVKCDGKMQATILSPRGPTVTTLPESAICLVGNGARPKIPGLYDVEDCPDVAIEIRYSDNDDEIDYVSAAFFMTDDGRKELAVSLAQKALQKDQKNLIAKLIILSCEPTMNVGDLIPEKPEDAATLAIWWARDKQNPLEGLKITSTWLQQHRDHKGLIQANFLCAFMVYGVRLFQAMCGKEESLPYLENSTPLPDGAIDLVKKALSHSIGGIVSEVQRQVGDMDIKASGLAADVLKLCGLNNKVRLYTRQK
jgi:hypothetical protein